MCVIEGFRLDKWVSSGSTCCRLADGWRVSSFLFSCLISVHIYITRPCAVSASFIASSVSPVFLPSITLSFHIFTCSVSASPVFLCDDAAPAHSSGLELYSETAVPVLAERHLPFVFPFFPTPAPPASRMAPTDPNWMY